MKSLTWKGSVKEEVALFDATEMNRINMTIQPTYVPTFHIQLV